MIGDVATVVSIMPIAICERKSGLIPMEFKLDPCKDPFDPSTLLIKNVQIRRYLEKWEVVLVPEESDIVANSICQDYCKAEWAVDEDGKPGIFWVKGAQDSEDIVNTVDFEMALEKQNVWFNRLVKIADDVWKKKELHQLVPESARVAARALKILRPWILDVDHDSFRECLFCISTIPKRAVICPNCKSILDSNVYKERMRSLGIEVPEEAPA